MKSERRYAQRPGVDIRESAARICDRLARSLYEPGSEPQAALAEAALRIRRMPVAGLLKAKPKRGLIR